MPWHPPDPRHEFYLHITILVLMIPVSQLVYWCVLIPRMRRGRPMCVSELPESFWVAVENSSGLTQAYRHGNRVPVFETQEDCESYIRITRQNASASQVDRGRMIEIFQEAGVTTVDLYKDWAEGEYREYRFVQRKSE